MNKNHKVTPQKVDSFIAALHVGQNKALKARQLCRKLGITIRGKRPSEQDERIVRMLANAARKAGHFFASDENGYFVPANLSQGMPCLRRFQRQAHDMMKSYKTLRKQMADEFGGQETLEL